MEQDPSQWDTKGHPALPHPVRDRCWLIQNARHGGGNPTSASNFVVRRTAAIGDALAATVVADKLIERGIPVVFQSHPNCHCVLRRHPSLSGISEPNGFCHINLDGAYERDAGRRNKTFAQMFLERANEQLSNLGMNLGPPRNCKPRIYVQPGEGKLVYETFTKYPKPWVFICPRSNTYNVRQVADGTWAQAAPKIVGTKFWLGTHPAPPGIVDLHAQHFDHVILWLSVADLLVSVDTGPMHVAAALGVPVLAINQSSSPHLHLNDQNDFLEISPPGLACLNCQVNLCPINQVFPPCQSVPSELIATWANARLKGLSRDGISVVIPIARPPAERLNRCLAAVIQQVDEIVVTCDQNGKVPDGATRDPKIRYVQHRERDIGYGRNVNFGARHTLNNWLWLLNDDVYVAGDCAAKLLECAKPGVGLIGHLLRDPDGRIQHGGKFRTPGMRGWGHVSQGMLDNDIREVMEMENVTGASILVNRQAFYEINGNDEDFFFYAVDDDMCLSLRHRGYKIMFTPHATAVHEEAASSRHDGRIFDWVRQGNAAFDRKWRWWIDQNINTVPGKCNV